MKKIIVTPAGRQKYLEVLFLNLLREKKDFDEWHLWLNTNVESDINYCREMSSSYEWIKVVEIPGINEVNSSNICRFFKYAQDNDAVYIRLDDDVVFLEDGFFEKFLKHRLLNKKPFLVFANIINNAIISHIHQRNGLIKHPILCGYECMDVLGWNNGEFAEKIHRTFIGDIRSGQIEKWHTSFTKWTCNYFERVSINAISWLGLDMARIKAKIAPEEEEYLTIDVPKMLNRPNEIFGGAIVSHFAFHTQRRHMDNTDILAQYKELAQNAKQG